MHYCTAPETFSCKHTINYIWWSNSPLNVEREKSCNIIVVYKSTFNGLAAHQSESQWLRDVNQRPETMSPNHPHLKESRPSHPDRTGLRIRNPERPNVGLWVHYASKTGVEQPRLSYLKSDARGRAASTQRLQRQPRRSSESYNLETISQLIRDKCYPGKQMLCPGYFPRRL